MFAHPNGTFLHVVHGQAMREIDSKGEPPTATHETQGPFNYPFDKPRKGQFQRYRDGPALIHKLGHYGYVCKEFQTELEFYTGNFNFVHSDILYLPQFPDREVMTFMHLDLGKSIPITIRFSCSGLRRRCARPMSIIHRLRWPILIRS